MKPILEFMGVVLAFIGMVTAALVAVFFTSFIFAFIIEFIWNHVLIDLFKLPEIGYWQSFGLLVFSNLIFKSNVSETKVEKKDTSSITNSLYGPRKF